VNPSAIRGVHREFFDRARALGRRLPALKRFLIPIWIRFTHACWLVRNLATGRRPICVPAGDQSILLHPEGQIAEILWVADFEAAERDFVIRVVRPGMRVVNIGANIGLYVAITGRLIGPKGEVHAFEPSRATYARLERNIALNELSNVAANNIALSDAKGRLVLRSDPRNQSLDGHRFVESLPQSATVAPGDEVIPCDTLDAYFSASGRGKSLLSVDLMIMDVEGAEWSVLKGGLALLRASPNVLLVLECSKNRQEVGEFLAREEFRFYAWEPASSRLEPVEFAAAASIGTVVAYRGAAEEVLSRGAPGSSTTTRISA
jgi:FkbM family methyltransferase